MVDVFGRNEFLELIVEGLLSGGSVRLLKFDGDEGVFGLGLLSSDLLKVIGLLMLVSLEMGVGVGLELKEIFLLFLSFWI